MSEVKIALQKGRMDFISKIHEEFREGLPNLRIQDVLTKLSLLNSNWEKFEKTHERLADSKNDSILTTDYFTKSWYNKCLERYSDALANLLTLKDELEKDRTPSGSNLADTSAHLSHTPSRAYLPKITLKNFAGDYIEWQSYSDLFVTIVGNNAELTNVEKMHYLRSTLQGDAAQLINSLPNSGNSFPIAWDLLVQRYENKRILITSELQKLLSPPSPSSHVSKVLQAQINSTSESVSALKSLGAPVEHWDMLLVHLLVHNLDSASREAWELHLGSTSEYPTLEQLKTFISGRARALENLELEKGKTSTHVPIKASSRVNSSRFSAPPSRSHSTTASATPRETSHSTFQCDDCGEQPFIVTCGVYKARTPNDRARLVQGQRLCFNCLGTHNLEHTRIHLGVNLI